MEYFIMPTKICLGEGSLEELRKIDAKHAFVLCDPFMKSSGKADIITDLLQERGISYRLFDKVVPDPSIELVAEIVCELADETDTIIALGGGSAIDAAKVVRKLFETAKKERVTFIAIPTTSGTGSELTSFAVITDKENHTKIPLIDNELLPDIAILDCDFTKSVPAGITADTGIDVLTHALEAIASTAANDFTDAYAMRAVLLVFKYLKRTVKDGNDMEARSHMHNASAMAGVAFNAASLGICHSLAHALGGHFHIPHGKSNALLLTRVMEYNTVYGVAHKETIRRYAETARMLGVASYDEKASAKALIRQVELLVKSVNIPAYINELVDAEAYKAAIPEMAKVALADRCTATNPKQPSVKDLERIYKSLIKNSMNYS